MIIYMLTINFISNQSGWYLFFKWLLIIHAKLWYNSESILQKKERKYVNKQNIELMININHNHFDLLN